MENKIKTLVRDGGAATVGIASRERLSTVPPSGDPGYLLPSTRSIVSFAIPLDRAVMREYFSKKDWASYGANQKEILQTLYGINDLLVRFLKEEGHDLQILHLFLNVAN